tara:strand:- start:59 stop:658 length:600 start_codon:yes stop_codon:yes gene_type:complete
MSRIRANTITNKAATGAPTFSNGAVVTGVCTATSFAGSGAALTGISAGLFSSYAIIADVKANNTHGSSSGFGSNWTKRDLNTEITDPDGIVSINNNQFTLQAGTYFIESQSIIHRGNMSQSRLYNATDSSVVEYGMSVHCSDHNSGNVLSPVFTRVTIGSAKAFEMQSRVTNSDTENGGLANNFGNIQIFTIIKIFKEN